MIPSAKLRMNLSYALTVIFVTSLHPLNSFTLPLLSQCDVHTIHRCRCFIHGTRMYATVSSQTQEELLDDIAALRERAALRLDALLEQMEDLKQLNEMYQQRQQQHMDDGNKSLPRDGIVVETTMKETKASLPVAVAPVEIPVLPTPATETTAAPTTITNSLNLLDDTSWKIVYNIGREKGTWMPKDWAVSGDRLLFQCSVQFTKVTLLSSNDNNNNNSKKLYDEFFHGSTDTKQLIVKDAFIIPRGVGSSSVGRRPLPVQPMGAYKVCRNQGPCGTDIVRLYIELNDDVTVPDHPSDVYCPSGRIYATCGYFPVTSKHDPKKPSLRETALEQYNAALRDYELKQFQVESDARGLLNVDRLKLMKESWNAKKNMEQMALQLRDARQREPEKSQLRLNSAQTVGLTREGGVCCKVHKGLALEYHILGQIEVGCIDDSHH